MWDGGHTGTHSGKATLLDGQICQVRNPHGAEQLRLNGCERLERRRVYDWLGILEAIDNRAALGSAISETLDQHGVFVVIGDIVKAIEGFELLGSGGEIVIDVAAPELALLKTQSRLFTGSHIRANNSIKQHSFLSCTTSNRPQPVQIMAQKTVLVTGTSAGGIGSAIVTAFSEHNCRIFATARNPAKAAHLASLPGVEILSLDVTSTDSVMAAVEAVSAKTGGKGLDVLVNNAGTGYTMPLIDADLDEGKRLFETNLWGMLAMVKAFVPLLVKARGTVVNISSVGGVVYTPWIGESIVYLIVFYA